MTVKIPFDSLPSPWSLLCSTCKQKRQRQTGAAQRTERRIRSERGTEQGYGGLQERSLALELPSMGFKSSTTILSSQKPKIGSLSKIHAFLIPGLNWDYSVKYISYFTGEQGLVDIHHGENPRPKDSCVPFRVRLDRHFQAKNDGLSSDCRHSFAYPPPEK